MILYVDSSALVKRYLTEAGSTETMAFIDTAKTVGTVLITRAEIAAALAKAIRVGALTKEEATAQLEAFRKEWNDYERLVVNETLVARADLCAWQYQLRGYDAVHLAAGMIWRESLDAQVTFATYDKKLWTVARQVGLEPFPENLVED